jgi:hypothetical protein
LVAEVELVVVFEIGLEDKFRRDTIFSRDEEYVQI